MDVAQRVSTVRERVAQAAERSGRDPGEIRILAATKDRGVPEIMAAIRSGIDVIGENTVQSALSKFEFLPPGIEKHMIGTLQPNKAKSVVQLFHLIESVDSSELAQAIDREAAKLGRQAPYPVLIEVNPSGEASKRGVRPDDAASLCEQINERELVNVEGLMAMMPYADDPETLRPHFRRMRALFDCLSAQFVAPGILSMGMTNDYEIAVEEGATLVRLGTCLFGPREAR